MRSTALLALGFDQVGTACCRVAETVTEAWQVYSGPLPEHDQRSARASLSSVQRQVPEAYALLLDTRGPRIRLAP